jgi:hypothetical protein
VFDRARPGRRVLFTGACVLLFAQVCQFLFCVIFLRDEKYSRYWQLVSQLQQNFAASVMVVEFGVNESGQVGNVLAL